MNYVDKVFEMLRVEPKEEFYIRATGKIQRGCEDKKIVFRITEELLVELKTIQGNFVGGAYSIMDILKGRAEIVKIPKQIKPTKNEQLAIDYTRLCGYKWLAKDKDGRVYAFEEKPVKLSKQWGCNCNSLYVPISISFISWEDDEPYEL